MRQLFIRDNATTLFFEDNVEDEQIANWIRSRMNDMDNPFNLNEAYSCEVIVDSDSFIVISGDEDLVHITVEEVRPIIV